MKQILTVLLLLASVSVWAQVQTIGNKNNTVRANGRLDADSGTYSKGAATLTENDSSYMIGLIHSYSPPDSSVGGVINFAAAGTSIPAGSIAQVLSACCFVSQVPTASLSGGSNIEKHSSGTFSATLSWAAGRQASTAPLSSIVVAGTTQSFSQPSAPGTISGSQSVTLTYNTNVSFTNTVTATDSKTASATTTFTFLNSRYWGTTANSAANNSDLLAGSHELSSTRSKSSFGIAVSGSNQHIYYAYPSSLGNLTSLVVGGFESIGAFILSTATITNASGYSETFNIYTSNNTFSSTTISGIIPN